MEGGFEAQQRAAWAKRNQLFHFYSKPDSADEAGYCPLGSNRANASSVMASQELRLHLGHSLAQMGNTWRSWLRRLRAMSGWWKTSEAAALPAPAPPIKASFGSGKTPTSASSSWRKPGA